MRRFSLRNLHCGTFTAELSLRKPHCGAPAGKLPFSASIHNGITYRVLASGSGGSCGGGHGGGGGGGKLPPKKLQLIKSLSKDSAIMCCHYTL